MLTAWPCPFLVRWVVGVPTAPVVTLVAPHKEDRPSRLVEGEQHPNLGATCGSRPELLHVAVPAAHHGVDQRPSQSRTFITQDTQCCQQRLRIRLSEAGSPGLKHSMELDVPRCLRHTDNTIVIGIYSGPLVGVTLMG